MRTRVKFDLFIFIVVLMTAFAAPPLVTASAVQDVGAYEGRRIAAVEIAFEGSPPDPAAEAEFLLLLQIAPNTEYSAVRVRDSLHTLFDSGRVASARVEVLEVAGPAPAEGTSRPVSVRFIVRRQVLVGSVLFELSMPPGAPVAEDEIRARLNMLDPGMRLSEQALRNNADLIQAYLRDRGFFRADVDYTSQLDASGTRATVIYRISVGEQARVGDFTIEINGFDPSGVRQSLSLHRGSPFTREALGEDLNRIRQAIIAQGRLAPQLDEPQVSLDPSGALIGINLTGRVGPRVDVAIKGYDLSERKQRELLPIKREGNVDISAIVEGERRLRNELQEDGYFFAEVTAACTVTPPTPTTMPNGTPQTCETIDPEELTGHTINITYNVELGRRFKLTDVRIEGTDLLTYEDLKGELRTQEASLLGFIPFLGYGRGYTSLELLERDRRTIEARMRDLGYRSASAEVRQGVSIDGESLIITFAVNEGQLTRVADVEIRGNQIYTEKRLRDELQTVIGGPFSRSQSRANADRILDLYARNGYVDAQVNFSVVELPARDGDAQVRLVYTVENEGNKVFINRILVNGNVLTEREAILNAIPLKEGDVLRADELADSERILYGTDAFRQVIIRTQPAVETATGVRKRDVMIDVEELRPRVLSYGGGYSTDTGPLVFADLRNVNLFGKLRQGAVRARFSERQQLMRFEYFDPRFQRYGVNRFAPLTVSAQYLRDSTITRFFRSTIDRGNFGIVQRLDEDGNPIDEFGEPTGEPTINRFTVNAETQRVIDRDSRSIVFLRYTYQDVRIYNTGSLLIKEVLAPDRKIRISGIGASFVRDTRERCDAPSALLARLNNGRASQRCQYSQTDATRGDFLSLDYSLSMRQLGGNISFNKLLLSYRRYYQVPPVRGTVLAGNFTLGLANVINPRDRDGNGLIDESDRTMPISERFFAGGSTTLRGFDFEEAGPRMVITPQGQFRNREGELVTLNPFTVPIGGNALAVVNLEARVPLTNAFQIVPFYDGGNVFRRVGDLFGRDKVENPDINARNLDMRWTHTVGLGLRIKTPIGGALAIDYGFLLNPPEFLIPQGVGPPATFRLQRGQLHFRFTQTF
ncbi:MAG TPA: POTRA domain-containing protein [Pyrinomonadaceae bacterium]|nr:POTRA domain-containing protein [Pyrinomonadaceae bacterium]